LGDDKQRATKTTRTNPKVRDMGRKKRNQRKNELNSRKKKKTKWRTALEPPKDVPPVRTKFSYKSARHTGKKGIRAGRTRGEPPCSIKPNQGVFTQRDLKKKINMIPKRSLTKQKTKGIDCGGNRWGGGREGINIQNPRGEGCWSEGGPFHWWGVDYWRSPLTKKK